MHARAHTHTYTQKGKQGAQQLCACQLFMPGPVISVDMHSFFMSLKSNFANDTPAVKIAASSCTCMGWMGYSLGPCVAM